jgi:hypothetical protein
MTPESRNSEARRDAVLRQRPGKHVPVAMNTLNNRRISVHGVFFAFQCHVKGKQAINVSQNFLLMFLIPSLLFSLVYY